MWGPQGFKGDENKSAQVKQAAPEVTSSTQDQSMDQSFDGTPVMPVYSAEVQQQPIQRIGEENTLLINKFKSYRRKSHKYGRCIMYLGYISIVFGFFQFASNIVKIFAVATGRGYFREMNEHSPFSRNQIVFYTILDTIIKAIGILSSYYLVKATKIPVRQLSQQTYDSNTKIQKYQEVVQQIRLYILLIFVIQMLITAVNGFIAYDNMNSYFEDKWKDKYDEYKNANLSDKKHKYDEAQMNSLQQAQTMITYYGPISILVMLAFSSCCFGTVYFCFIKYMKNLTRFENSPQNPANSKTSEQQQV